MDDVTKKRKLQPKVSEIVATNLKSITHDSKQYLGNSDLLGIGLGQNGVSSPALQQIKDKTILQSVLHDAPTPVEMPKQKVRQIRNGKQSQNSIVYQQQAITTIIPFAKMNTNLDSQNITIFNGKKMSIDTSPSINYLPPIQLNFKSVTNHQQNNSYIQKFEQRSQSQLSGVYNYQNAISPNNQKLNAIPLNNNVRKHKKNITNTNSQFDIVSYQSQGGDQSPSIGQSPKMINTNFPTNSKINAAFNSKVRNNSTSSDEENDQFREGVMLQYNEKNVQIRNMQLMKHLQKLRSQQNSQNQVQNEIRLESLDPQSIGNNFNHKNLLIPNKGLNNNILKKRDLWISRANDKEFSIKAQWNKSSTQNTLNNQQSSSSLKNQQDSLSIMNNYQIREKPSNSYQSQQLNILENLEVIQENLNNPVFNGASTINNTISLGPRNDEIIDCNLDKGQKFTKFVSSLYNFDDRTINYSKARKGITNLTLKHFFQVVSPQVKKNLKIAQNLKNSTMKSHMKSQSSTESPEKSFKLQ
eukprot:403377298